MVRRGVPIWHIMALQTSLNAHGKGVFGERTPEILRWMRKMKRIEPSKRNMYKYGNDYQKIYMIK